MEGPSLVILKEELQPFAGKKVLSAVGNTKKIDKEKLVGKKVIEFLPHGKHFLIVFDGFYLRIHFLMFGSYRANADKEGREPRLALHFKNGFVNFYSCSVIENDGNPRDAYDWEVDVMADEWNGKRALQTVKKHADAMVCDVLLDQKIFAGSGNIIKNEVLFRIRVHPESRVGALPPKKLKQMVDETRAYSLEFYQLKKIYQLSKHWQVYKKRICTNCGGPVEQRKTGKLIRRSFICNRCQIRM